MLATFIYLKLLFYQIAVSRYFLNGAIRWFQDLLFLEILKDLENRLLSSADLVSDCASF